MHSPSAFKTFPTPGPETDEDLLKMLLLHPIPASRDVCLEELQLWAGVRAGFCLQYAAGLSNLAGADLGTSSST